MLEAAYTHFPEYQHLNIINESSQPIFKKKKSSNLTDRKKKEFLFLKLLLKKSKSYTKLKYFEIAFQFGKYTRELLKS